VSGPGVEKRGTLHVFPLRHFLGWRGGASCSSTAGAGAGAVVRFFGARRAQLPSAFFLAFLNESFTRSTWGGPTDVGQRGAGTRGAGDLREGGLGSMVVVAVFAKGVRSKGRVRAGSPGLLRTPGGDAAGAWNGVFGNLTHRGGAEGGCISLRATWIRVGSM